MEIYEATIPLTGTAEDREARKPVKAWHLAAIFVLLLIAIASTRWTRASDADLTVRFLDIGQGDSILISTDDGKHVLIDGGPDGAVLSKLGTYLPAWDRTIDVVVATHMHSDHIGGLIDVLERYEVEHIIEGFESYDSATFTAWRAAVRDEGSVVTEAVADTVISLGSSISLTVIYPNESRAGLETRDANSESVVVLLRHNDVSMLFTGDAETDNEAEMVSGNRLIPVDVLKVGHHGSKTSTTEAFLSVVHPQVALISVGAGNRYGHPHQVTLSRLERHGIPYYRTDQHGDVTITSDGHSFQVTTER